MALQKRAGMVKVKPFLLYKCKLFEEKNKCAF
jgi:hypothetical protein